MQTLETAGLVAAHRAMIELSAVDSGATIFGAWRAKRAAAAVLSLECGRSSHHFRKVHRAGWRPARANLPSPPSTGANAGWRKHRPRGLRARTGEDKLSPNSIVLALTALGTCIICAAVAPLLDVAALMPSRDLRRTWRALTASIGLCLGLFVAFMVLKWGSASSAADVVVAVVLVIGPSFVLGVAVLSRRTARDLLRVAALEEAALLDPLTGLGNRRLFDERLAAEMRYAAASGRPLSLVVLDIDHFKRINDAHGHAGGDTVLRRVAALVSALGRSGDTACRIGGEEFAVIVPGLPASAAAGLADRLRCAVAAAEVALPDGATTCATVSLGVSTLEAGEDAETFVRRADAALYAAKRAGRDRVRLAA